MNGYQQENQNQRNKKNRKNQKRNTMRWNVFFVGLVSFLGCILPLTSFAATSDTTGSDLVSQIKTYLSGDLGLLMVISSFVMGAIRAAVTHALGPMLQGLGIALAIHYGPDILTSVFGAVI